MKNKSHITRALHILTIMLLFVVQAKAQSYFFRHYQVESGLSNNMVYCSLQDSYGFMWFGTKDGLNRFDGYHFKTYNTNDKGNVIMPDAISCLATDSNNDLWVGCQKGLYKFDYKKERLIKFLDSFIEIYNLQLDKVGNLWFRSRLTLCRYNLTTGALKVYDSGKYFEATTLALSAEGDIWSSSSDGKLQQFDAATETFKSFDIFIHSKKASSKWIQTICPAGKGSLYVGTSSQGIKQFDLIKKDYTDLLTLNLDKTTVYVRDIKQYAENEFWFGTESGIFILNTDTKKFTNLKHKFLNPYSLSDNAIYTLCKDKEGGIWAGTYFGGVNYYSKEYAVFQKYFPDNSTNSISGSVVREICEDNSSNLWIGTEDAGLNRLNTKTGIFTQFKPTGSTNSIAYTNIHGLMVTGNQLWIGTFEHGLDVMDLRSNKIIKHYAAGPGKKELKSNFIVCMMQSSKGEIYIGTSNSLFRYDRRTDGFDEVTEVEPNNFIACIFEGHDQKIWVGTQHHGLYFFDPETKQKGHFENNNDGKNNLTNNGINAIIEDSSHNLWLATEGGGICKLSKGKQTFTSYTMTEGLPSNFVFKILADDKKHLWITTSRGLATLNPENNNIQIYTKDNGLLNDQFNYNSGYKDATGKMYFGSIKGMISFSPDDFSKTSTIPPVYITGLQVQNKELEINEDSSFLKKSIVYTNEILLPYDRSSFSIDFAALSFISPEMTTYSYYMKGLDKEWTEIKPNRKIYFTNLLPGKYIFKLKAAVNGQWSKEQKELTIRITPPFWATTWAYLLYVIIGSGLVYYLLRTYHIILEDRKEKEIHKAKIDFFTNVAHEIRTPLTLIKGPVDNLLEIADDLPQIKEDVVMMDRNTNRLITLITQILDFRQTETKGFSIDFDKVNITEILKEFYENFSALAVKKKLEYTIDIPPIDIYAFADEEAINKILSNLFNNAIKYATKKVHISLLPYSEQADSFTIEFENDGLIIPAPMREKIFEPFYRIKETIKKQGTGLGLALARSLAELHNGNLYIKDNSTGVNIFVLCLPLKPERQTNGKFKISRKI